MKYYIKDIRKILLREWPFHVYMFYGGGVGKRQGSLSDP
jgi:hypothetical protein